MVRVVVFAFPIVAASVVAVGVSRFLPEPTDVVGSVVWWLLFLAGALLPLVVLTRLSYRLLPLSALLKLTLLFPDRAPSRLKVARIANRTRDLKQRLAQARDQGVDDNPTQTAETVLALITALGAHDRRTRGHSERVRAFVDMLADEAGVTVDDQAKLRWAALLHDIGKLSVAGEILNKPGKPDPDEWEVIRRHPTEGARIVSPLAPWLGEWVGAVEEHHERFDGSGYPHGLSSTQISLAGRILAIADSFETMTAARPYKKPMSPTTAREELVRCAGTHFDPRLVRAFVNISVGRLWWTIGFAAFLAQLPVLGGLSYRGIAQRVGRSVATAAGTTAAVATMSMAGLLNLTGLPTEPGRPSAAGAAEAPEGAAPPSSSKTVKSQSSSGDAAPSSRPSVPSSPAPGEGDLARRSEVLASDPMERDEGSDDERPRGGLTEYGRITAANPMFPSRPGVTQRDFLSECSVPNSLGVDGWVVALEPPWAGLMATVVVSGSNSVETYDLDLQFYSLHCELLGTMDTARLGESGRMPANSYFVFVNASLGVDTGVRLHLEP
ncbi:MAG: HD-GYP domain-containing protein [Actinomycetota bacterium]